MSEPDEFDHLADPEQEEAARDIRAAARLQEDQDRDDFMWLMGNRQGRRFMWSLLDTAGVNSDPFVPGSADLTAHRCGRASIGREYLDRIMRECPERYHLMMKERLQDVRKYQRIASPRADG